MQQTTDAAFARRMLELALGVTTKPALDPVVVDDLMMIAVTMSDAGNPDIYTGAGLNRAASIGWQAKSALTSDQYDLGGGSGITLDRSQWFAHCMTMAALFGSGGRGVLDGGGTGTRRSGIGSIGLTTEVGADYWRVL